MKSTWYKSYDYGIKEKRSKKKVSTTMVDFNNKFLNDSLMYTSIRIVEMTSRWWGWKPFKRNIILLKIKKVRVNVLYFAPLRFIRQEWSVAQSIFNIKARGLAHCLLWVKLGKNDPYGVDFNDNMALSDGRTCKKYFMEISIKVRGTCTSKIITNKQNTP